MKKLIVFIFLIVGIVAVFDLLERNDYELQDLTQTVKNSETVENIKQEVLTSGPLVSKLKNSQSQLSLVGIVEWTNQQRAINGLPKLTVNAKLSEAAELKVQDMFKGQYFDHISPNGTGPSDLANQVGYRYIRVGENLALGNYKDDRELVQAWMDSPGHRENILNSKFTEIGIGIGKGIFEGESTWLAVQEFGKPASECPAVDTGLKFKIENLEQEVNSLEPQINLLKRELESMSLETKKQYEEYNQKVSEHNSLIKIFNNKVDVLKSSIEQYNTQVKSYNLCASG